MRFKVLQEKPSPDLFKGRRRSDMQGHQKVAVVACPRWVPSSVLVLLATRKPRRAAVRLAASAAAKRTSRRAREAGRPWT